MSVGQKSKIALGEEQLILEVGYEGLPDTRSAGKILEELGRAYTLHQASLGRRAVLKIAEVHVSSLWASLRDFVSVAGNVVDAITELERLQDFVRTIGASLETVIAANGGNIPPSIVRLIQAIIRPVAKGEASHSKLFVKGDNALIIYIERADAIDISRLLSSPPQRSKLRLDPPGSLPKDGPSAATLAHMGVPFEYIANKYGTDVGFYAADYDGVLVQASLHQVDGRWFARPADLRGILLPVNDESSVSKLDRNKAYVASGAITRVNAIPTSFRPEDIRATNAKLKKLPSRNSRDRRG